MVWVHGNSLRVLDTTYFGFASSLIAQSRIAFLDLRTREVRELAPASTHCPPPSVTPPRTPSPRARTWRRGIALSRRASRGPM
mgnify:CR=1 FL=1